RREFSVFPRAPQKPRRRKQFESLSGDYPSSHRGPGGAMQVTGMLYGSKLLQFAGFPTSEVLGPDASEEEIKALIGRHGSVFVKPVFKGGVGKKGKAGLLGRCRDLKTALS